MMKFARSPTNAVEVPLNSSFRTILQNSIITAATGPKANAPIRAGISLKSIL